MTLVVFPFRHDDLAVFERSIAVASSHPAVTRVLCVGDQPPHQSLIAAATRAAGGGATVEVVCQERIGELRPGKGDAVLTGIRRFVEEGTEHRLHFYDADIRTLSPRWVDVAERALDDGADVAKHFFHRAATDAQITWHVTKPGAAMLWPESPVPDVRQPLGGELALTRGAAETLWASPQVRRRSDWGIDTVLTVEMLRTHLAVDEVFVPDGKEHGYYESLADLRIMLVECIDALQGVAHLDLGVERRGSVDPEEGVPEAIRATVAFDAELTRGLIDRPLPAASRALVEAHPALLPDRVEAWDDDRWARALRMLLDGFRLGDPAWEEVAFRAWAARVLYHTTVNVPLGYERAMAALDAAVDGARRGPR